VYSAGVLRKTWNELQGADGHARIRLMADSGSSLRDDVAPVRLVAHR